MTGKTLLLILGIAVLGAFLGFGLGRASQESPGGLDAGAGSEHRDETREEMSGPRRVEAPEPRPVESRSEPPSSRDRSSGEGTNDELISAALLAHFEQGFAAGWRELRPDEPDDETHAEALRAFRAELLELPGSIGRRLAGGRNERDQARAAVAAGEGLDLLAALQAGTWAPDPESNSEQLLDRVLERRTSGREVPASALDDADFRLEDGMILRFPAGHHRLSYRRLWKDDRQTFPSDLRIVGAGMDLTIVTLDGDISGRGHLERLGIADLTLDTGNDHTFDLRGPDALSLDLERVRIVRFDCGHGGSVCFGVSAGIVLRARRSEFLCGYGKSPPYGNLARGAASWMSFDDCRFRAVELAEGAAVQYRRCRFTDYVEDPRRSPRAGFLDCVLDPLVPREEAARLRERIPLSTLFPGFEDR